MNQAEARYVSTVLIISWGSDSWVNNGVDTSTRHRTCPYELQLPTVGLPSQVVALATNWAKASAGNKADLVSKRYDSHIPDPWTRTVMLRGSADSRSDGREQGFSPRNDEPSA